MKKYICECCGGHIDERTMTCEFCGTKFKREYDDVIRIETFHNPVKTFTACVELEDMLIKEMSADYAAHVLIGKLSAELANALPSCMIIEDEHDIGRRKHRVSGTIKLVEPKEQTTLPPFRVC